ncbi:MAG: hypothetical protein JW809_03585 [Pirellulales bacterium]|nr:hypothetical protein [Pirellulales bacterium]
MEARLARVVLLAAALVVSLGASHRSVNFVVEAPTAPLAQRIAAAAETFRHDLAVSWLGRAMPPWSAPCVMNVRVDPRLGAGGTTTFLFENGEVFGWRMSIQGSHERILDSVLPHEITHMILATHFRCPLPRWADEGAATSVEHPSEREKHFHMLNEFLTTDRGIAFNQMFAMREYPRDVMPLYAQGYSLAEYLIQRGGRRRFIAYIEDGIASGQWGKATERHYGIQDLGALQNTWLAWIRQGHPTLTPRPTQPEAAPSAEMLATAPPGIDAARLAGRDPNVPPDTLARLDAAHLALNKRPRPEPNLVYHEPRLASRPKHPLVPIAPDELAPASSPAPQLARPQPAEPVRQIILEWRK